MQREAERSGIVIYYKSLCFPGHVIDVILKHQWQCVTKNENLSKHVAGLNRSLLSSYYLNLIRMERDNE